MEKHWKNLVIRGIRPNDAEQIGAIQASITKSGPQIDFDYIIQAKLQGSEDVSFVAEIEGKVVGYMISYLIYGGFGLEKTAWIATLGVHPKYMGQGIGERLAQEILEVYKRKGIKHILTSVRWDSVDLLSFFKTLGFNRSDFINLIKDLEA